ncbi:MAG: hypothetical protein B7Y45_09300 [Sphingomonas sp. 28-66-16]|nr:MAG: hypothetical protein B7Y45_09300 [Sphingomonas sp. 28-66-16]
MDEDHLTEIARGPLVILARSLAGTPSVHRRCMSIHCAGRSLQIEEAEQLVDQWFGQGVRSA